MLIDKRKFSKFCMFILSRFCKIQKKIHFTSLALKQYADSTRVISERMHELYPDYKLVWEFKAINDKYNIIPDYIEIVKTPYARMKAKVTSFCHVTTMPFNVNVYKRKKQFFIQTWHGDRGFKKVLYDKTINHKNFKIADKKMTDLCVAASEYGTKVYRSAFRYNGEILQIGMPRNDKLVNGVTADEKIKIREKIGIDLNCKVLLYAPTYRDNNTSNQNVDVDLMEVIERLEKKGEKWIVLVRRHMIAKSLSIEGADNIIDVSDYHDMADLLYITDMLISDYSSCSLDFALTKKPIILAAYDKEEYANECREFNVDIEETGLFVAKTQEELISIINSKSPEDYSKSCERALKYYGTTETGRSTDVICERINKFYIDNFKN